MSLDDLVKQHRVSLRETAKVLKEWGDFSFDVPCAVLDSVGGTTTTTSLGHLSFYLPTSYAMSSEPIERFLRLKEKVGFDAAFEAMSADDEVGEEFVQAWDEAMGDLDRGVLVTLNDLVAFVEQAKRGWESNPRKLLVVGLERQTVTSGLVSTVVFEV